MEFLTNAFIIALLAATVRMSVPLIYAGLGEVFLERAGIVNIGLEGVMLSGAFFSYAGALYSGSLWVGLLCGALGGILVSAIHGFLCINLAQNQSVSGLAINMFMLGVTSFLYVLMTNGKSYTQITTFQTIEIPLLSKIPYIGQAFFNQDILTYILYAILIVMILFYTFTSAGLSFKAIGEYPKSAESAGIPVSKYKWIAILINGALSGIGGSTLILVQLGKFSENMIAGRGYIALAAVILGRYTPLGTFGAALLFGGASALQIRLQAVGVQLPSQVLTMLPYVITLIALIFSAGKKSEPESLAKPYIRGAR